MAKLFADDFDRAKKMGWLVHPPSDNSSATKHTPTATKRRFSSAMVATTAIVTAMIANTTDGEP